MDFFDTTDLEKYGLGLTGVGILFSLLGIIFSTRLAAVGNALLICGVPLIIGLNSTMRLLMKPSNFKGIIFYAIGLFLVVIVGWPFWGMIMEGYGFFLLSSGFWPTIAGFLLKIIALGPLLIVQFIRWARGNAILHKQRLAHEQDVLVINIFIYSSI
uniref:Vesicle transport protein GOT1-like n=1 Tax=Cicer arietinum TaxID=3827 RepID=A0A3Q7X2G2_CICAR|nr:vesicle transport protein GOT1-like [Cicer arietinum]